MVITACLTIAVAAGLNVLREHGYIGASWAPAFGTTYHPRSEAAAILGKRSLAEGFLPSAEIVNRDGKELLVQYTTNEGLQRMLSSIIKKGSVRYAAFVAMDPDTGEVKALLSYGHKTENLALRATYPSASIFKIVTAGAAIENQRLSSGSLIPLKGSHHTLFRQNIFNSGGITPASADHRQSRYWRLITLADAFGKSVNSIFGKIGIFGVGPQGLRDFAGKLFFNRAIPFDLALDESRALIPDDPYGLAESASGFTRFNTMSPVHGALIASAVATGGMVMEPYAVNAITTRDGESLYAAGPPKELGRALSPETAAELRVLMERTVTSGTSRGAFRDRRRNVVLSQLEIGGKTGTLDGDAPRGRYDWFVGYATRGTKKLALAALCIHGDLRGIKASQLARLAMENYFKPDLAMALRPAAR
jgi:cell division protein FtsI/penicillin-binding protein 2